jgi:hypothetical protein
MRQRGNACGWDDRVVRTISSREVYRNAWLSVRDDEVVRADGSTGVYGVVDKPDFALVIPQDLDGFWLVEQFLSGRATSVGVSSGFVGCWCERLDH